MSDHKRFPIHKINPHLICILCSGYLIDATTIDECLHTFCKSCIVRYFESSNFCPACDVQVHKTDPLLSIRPDSVLQKLVYKLAPKIHHREMARRKKFYASNTKVSPVSLEDAGHDITRKYVLPEDTVCLALKPMPDDDSEEVPIRYFKCLANMKIYQLIKLIVGKFDLPIEHPVSVYAEQKEQLPISISLLDVACMKSLQRNQLMVLYYKIFFSKKVKFEKDISLRPGIVERNKQLAKNTKLTSKPVPTEPIPKKLLPKIAPAPPRNSTEASRLPQAKIASSGMVKTEPSLPTYKAILPLSANPADIITLNPYPISQPDNLANSYGLSVLPLCSQAIPTMLSNNSFLTNSFTTLGGTVLPMGIPLGANIICPSLTNPVFNQNITNIDLSSAPFAADGSKALDLQSACVQKSALSAPHPFPIKTEIDCVSETTSTVKTNAISDVENPDREVQMTISETGVVSFKSDGAASDTKALLNPIEAEACELLSRIETSNLIDSEDDSKGSDIPSGSSNFSEIKQEISFIIDNLEVGGDGVVDLDPLSVDDSKRDLSSEVVSIDVVTIKPTESATVPEYPKTTTEATATPLGNRTKNAKRKSEMLEARPSMGCKADRPISECGEICDNYQTPTVEVAEKQKSYTMPSKRPPAVGYKTLKSSPRGWYPTIPREEILKNSKLDRTTNKFFKTRNVLPRNVDQSPATVSKSISVTTTPTSNIDRSTGLSKPANKLAVVNHSSQSETESPKLLSPLIKQSVHRSRTKSKASGTDNESVPFKVNNSAIKALVAKHTARKGNEFGGKLNNNNTIGTCCSEDKIEQPSILASKKESDIQATINREQEVKVRMKSPRCKENVTNVPNKVITEVQPPIIKLPNLNISSIKDNINQVSAKGRPFKLNIEKAKTISLSQSTDKKNEKTKLCDTYASSSLKLPSRLEGQRGDSPENTKVQSPSKSCPKPEVPSSSLDTFNSLRTLQALSSLFPSSSSLGEAYDTRLPLSLVNGFDHGFPFNKSFPSTDMANTSSLYLPSLCGNMLQNLLIQDNPLSTQEAMSLLTSQDNLASNLLSMNFQNASSSYISNNFMGLAGTSSHGLNSDGSFLAALIRSQEARQALLCGTTSLSPTSPIVTSPPVNVSPGAKNLVKTKGSMESTKDKKAFLKRIRDTPKNTNVLVKSSSHFGRSETKVSPSLPSPKKKSESISFSIADSSLLNCIPHMSAENVEIKNNHLDDGSCRANISPPKCSKKTEAPELINPNADDFPSTKVNDVLSPQKITPQCHSPSIAQSVHLIEMDSGNEKHDTSTIRGSETEPASKAVTVRGSETEPASKVVTVRGSETEPASKVVTVRGSETQPPSKAVIVRGSETQPLSKPITFCGSETQPLSKPVTVCGSETEPASKAVTVHGSETEPASKAVTGQVITSDSTKISVKLTDFPEIIKKVSAIDDHKEKEQYQSQTKIICENTSIFDVHQVNPIDKTACDLDSSGNLHLDTEIENDTSLVGLEDSVSQVKCSEPISEVCTPAQTEGTESKSLSESSDHPNNFESNLKIAHDNTDISCDLLNVIVPEPCASFGPPDSILNPFDICSSDNIAIEKDLVDVPKFSPTSHPDNLPVCSTPKKTSIDEAPFAAINVSDLNESTPSRDNKQSPERDQAECESFSSSETSLRLVMDEGIFNAIETTPLDQSSSKDFNLPNALEPSINPKLSDVNEQLNSGLPTPSKLVIDTPSSTAMTESLEGGFALLNSAEKGKHAIVSNSVATADKFSVTGSESTPQNDPILLLNEQYSKSVTDEDVPSFPKAAHPSSSNIYDDRANVGIGQKTANLPIPKADLKAQNSSNNKHPVKNQMAMSNFASTDEFLQQLQSMTLPPAVSSSTPQHKPGSSGEQQQSWSTTGNNLAYVYACQQKAYTSDSHTACNQQYSLSGSSAQTKTSSPTRAAQFPYNQTYQQQKPQCSETGVKKTSAATAQENYSAMQSLQTASNHKYNYPLHPFSNCGYNSNYGNFFTNNTSQSPNLSSLMSGAGYNFNLSNPKMFSGQQSSYFGLNQGSTNNYISGNYGNNSGSNYQNSMNQYGFGNSNVNSNFGNNLGGSLHNFHFPYYNYNSYSHLYQGENAGLISHHASSLMPSFPGSSRGSLSPRNAGTPQPFNDLSFQSSLFPVMPFVSGLQSTSLGTSSPTSTHSSSKNSTKSSGTPKTSQRSGGSKSRKGTATGQAKTKATTADPKVHQTYPSGGAMPCASSYATNPTAATSSKANNYPSVDQQKQHDGGLSKSGQQMEQKAYYHMPHPASNSILYPHSSNSLIFDPSASNTPKPPNNKQFSTDFPVAGAMYNAHMNPNCSFH